MGVFEGRLIPLLDFSEIFRDVSIFYGRTCGIGLISGKNLKIAHLGGRPQSPKSKIMVFGH